MRRTPKTAVAITLIAIILFSTACQMPALPGRASPTPGEKGLAPTQATAPSEAPVETLPPTVVEATPNPASELPLDGTLTIAFNQPMDRASVEAALEFQPGLGGAIGWVDDTTLTFTPDAALAPASQVSLTVETTAKAANGLALTQPVQLSYRTVDYLRMSQGLPAAGATEIDPTSAIVATFNRPLVALGDDGQASLVPFTLDPPAEGRGEWVNTSTYVFYPDPALAGGKTYTVQISPDLVSTDSAPLDPAVRGDAAARSWSFTTAIPQVLQIEPTGSDLLRLDEGIALTFNQPMEPASVEQNMSILDDAGAKAVGTYEWNEDQTKVTFQPTNRWPRNAGIHLTLLGQAQGRGGTPIGVDMSTDFTTFPELQVLSSEPVQGGV
ncbi:MAG TPA: Ig-like domain-containing protein, partial [Anaerolineaceae bacterium]|nr:Ig-like domain-containing protein [Anaerolineaceae bacterium]